jgi:hypothetical protein
MLELARSLAELPRRQQEALCVLARVLAGAEALAGAAGACRVALAAAE